MSDAIVRDSAGRFLRFADQPEVGEWKPITPADEQFTRAMNLGAAVKRARDQRSHGVFANTLVEILTSTADSDERGMLLDCFLDGYLDPTG